MIILKIITDKGKINTDFKEKEITWNDISLVITEFEKIKKELLDYTFDGNDYLRINGG